MGKAINWIRLGVIISFCLLIYQSTASANWVAFVKGSVEQFYDSNIFLDPDDFHRPGANKSDFRTNLVPGFGIRNEGKRQNLSLEYDLFCSFFYNNSDQNYVGHMVDFNFERFLTEHIRFYMKDYVSVSEEPESATYDYVTVNYGRKKNLTNSGEGGIEFLMRGDSSLTFYYLDNRLYYLDDNDYPRSIHGNRLGYDDSVTYGPGTHLIYWFTKSHGIDVTYEWKRVDYDYKKSERRDYLDFYYKYRTSEDNVFYGNFIYDYVDLKTPYLSDYQIYRILVGLERKFSREWSAEFFGGYYYRTFNDDKVKVGDLIEDTSDDDGFVGGGSITYNQERWQLQLKGEYGLRIQYGDYNNRGFTRFRNIELNFDYNITDRLHSFISLFYEHEEYPNSLAEVFLGDRRREFYDALVGVEYLFLPWLSGKLQYEYSKESASRIRFDIPVGYTDHIGFIGLYANYDLLK